MEEKKHTIKRGRGAIENPHNRFEEGVYIIHEPTCEEDVPTFKTHIQWDDTQTILSTNNSPDLPFKYSLNPYRGCEHGCIYCYARPTHEYLGFSAGIDFESKLICKKNAAKKLKKHLMNRKWQPQPILMSGVTDPYQPIERKLKITRSCIEIFSMMRHPLILITKNYLITRDIDLLSQLAHYNAIKVIISVTTLDAKLANIMEPRTSAPKKRLETIRKLKEAGIPVSANIAPIIPGLTDHEIVNLLNAVAEAGADTANYLIVRLPYSVKDLFSNWLTHHFPDRKQKILGRIMDIRHGKLNNSEFGERFRGHGNYAQQIRQIFHIHKQRLGLNIPQKPLYCTAFRRFDNAQSTLF